MWSCTSWMVLTCWFCTILTHVGHRTNLGLWAIHIPSLTLGMNHISGPCVNSHLGIYWLQCSLLSVSLTIAVSPYSCALLIVTLNMVTLTFHRFYTTYKVFFPEYLCLWYSQIINTIVLQCQRAFLIDIFCCLQLLWLCHVFLDQS